MRSAPIAALPMCLVLGGCFAIAPASDVEVVVALADNGQPVQGALVEGFTGRSWKGFWGTAVGAPEYVYAYTDERGRATVRVFTGPSALGNSSMVSVKSPWTYYCAYGFDDERHDRAAQYRDGVLYMHLSTCGGPTPPKLSKEELLRTPFVIIGPSAPRPKTRYTPSTDAASSRG